MITLTFHSREVPLAVVDPVKIIADQDKFDDREVGLTHPDNGGFIRVCNNGDIELSSGEGVFVLGGRSRIKPPISG